MSLPSLLCFSLFSWNTSEKASGFSSARRDFTLHVRGRRRIVNEALITNVALFLPGLKNPSGDDSCSINFSLLFAFLGIQDKDKHPEEMSDIWKDFEICSRIIIQDLIHIQENANLFLILNLSQAHFQFLIKYLEICREKHYDDDDDSISAQKR